MAPTPAAQRVKRHDLENLELERMKVDFEIQLLEREPVSQSMMTFLLPSKNLLHLNACKSVKKLSCIQTFT